MTELGTPLNEVPDEPKSENPGFLERSVLLRDIGSLEPGDLGSLESGVLEFLELESYDEELETHVVNDR